MTMHSGYGDIDLDGLIDEDPPPSTQRGTGPVPGSATLEIDDKMVALFTSATWTLTATVRDPHGYVVISTSTDSSTAHSEPFKKRWARQLIRSRKNQLRQLGVDVEQVYVQWGGVLDDLEETF